MTFSIVARSADGRAWGVAVASKAFSVGSVVPAAEAGAGAIATQAMAHTGFKRAGLARLREGASAAEVLATLLEDDEGRDVRQVGIVDRAGRGATSTGASCPEHADGLSGDGYAVQGNLLAGAEVVPAMRAAFLASDAEAPLAERLLAALRAGDAAGGDARGRQSAALLVVREGAGFLGNDDVEIDLRVEDHVDPVVELGRLVEHHRQLWTGSAVPLEERTADSPELMVELEGRARALGFASFLVWIGQHDYERYGGPDWTATRVVEELREATPDWRP